MKKILTALLASFILLTPLAQAEGVFSSNKFSFLDDGPELMPVNQAFVIDFKQQGNQLKVSWVIADGYYIYRDKVKLEVEGAVIGEIALPRGKQHTDDYFGEQEVYYNFVEIPVALKEASADGTFYATFMGCAEGKLCFPPTKRSVVLQAVAANDGELPSKGAAINTDSSADASADTDATTHQADDAPITQQDNLTAMLSGDSILWTLMLFFGLGIGLALTPCVFPMYPILSGIIVGQGEKLSTAKAFTLSMAYVQGMAITYSILGLVVASAGLKYQAALQHPVVLIVLAVLFFVLSLSMFGLYNISLPSSLQEKLNSASNNQKGGNLIGVFVMGIISGLVASPCTTAPLSGALIYVAQTGDLLLGFLALYVLSMGMGIPLLIIGTSGGKLLPRAGAWMDVIKTVFGFLLIAVSIMMIGRIWTGLVSDVLWALWGIIFIAYLRHQNKLTTFGLIQTIRTVILGLLLLSSFSYGFLSVMQKLGFEMPSPQANHQQQASHEFKRIKTLADLERELAVASADGKTVMLDLYADWCIACKEFEAITFKDEAVLERMNKIVLLQADVTANDDQDIELLEHYDVLGLPTLLMFDADGKINDRLRVTGFMGPDDFAPHLDRLIK